MAPRRHRLSGTTRYSVAVAAIEKNLPCVSCSYLLRGLPEDGACPECGTDVRRSLQGDLLSAANPAWLRSIVRGQWLLTIGLMTAVGAVLIMVLGVAALVLIGLLLPVERASLVVDLTSGFMVGLGVILLGVPIGMCIALVGIFFVTIQEGRDMDREPMGSMRTLARWSMLGAIVSCAIASAMYLRPATGGWWWGTELIFRSVFIVLLTVAVVTLLKRMESVIRRVPDHQLANEIGTHWKSIRWTTPAAGIFLLILPGTGRVGGSTTMFATVVSIGFVVAIGLFVSSIPLAGTMLACSRRLQGCLASAMGASAGESSRTSTGSAS